MTENNAMADDGYLTWVFGGIVSIIGALAAAVTTLWSHSEAKNAQAIQILEQRSAQCEQDRKDLLVKIGKLELRVEQLEHAKGS